jgi:hypothetical protein
MKRSITALIGFAALGTASVFGLQTAGITSAKGNAKTAEFDLLETNVTRQGANIVFTQTVGGKAGNSKPNSTGKFAGSSVYSYVWPTSLDSSTVGFEAKQGVLALAATSHPDFDDTPKYDENTDGNLENDGNLWHTHWVVLVPDDTCGKGNLKVKDIPEGNKPKLPITWPGAPILIDSPGYDLNMTGSSVRIKVPLKELGFPKEFNFDGVTAGLRVNASVHNPLLCVTDVFDVASGDLSLPGKLR